MKILCLLKILLRDKICLPFCLLISVSLFAAQAMAIEIPLEKHGGVYTLQVRINGVFTLPFVLDSGASEVTIPADVALSLLRTGTISEKDFLPDKRFTLADGSIVTGSRFNIRELEVGGFRAFNIPAVVAPVTGSLLLGQSFLSKAPHWAIDNRRQLLVIDANPPRLAPVPESEVARAVPVDKSEVDFINGPGITGLAWGDSPAEAKDVMVRNDAVDRADVFCDRNKVVSKKARKHWEWYLPVWKNGCENDKKFNEEAEKHGQYFMNFHGTFMDRDAQVTLIFYKQKLYEVDIMFDDLKSKNLYFDLLTQLKVKHGPPDKSGNQDYGRNAFWAGAVPKDMLIYMSEDQARDVTDIFLYQVESKTDRSIITNIEYSDWKTKKIADERERQYNREVGLHNNKSESEKVSAPQSTPPSKSLIASLPDPPGKYAMLVKTMLDGAKNAEAEKIDHSKAELQASSKGREKCHSDEAREKNADGIAALSEERYEDALKHFHEAYMHCPQDVEILNNLALALTKTGDFDNAEKALFMALTLAPTRTNAWALLGQVLSIRGDVTGGCGCFLNAFRYTRSEKKTTEALQNLADNDPFPNTQEAARLALGKLGKGPPLPKPVVTIIDSVQAYYLENVHSGQVLVIEGEVLNESDKPVSYVLIEGKLFDRKDAIARTQRCYVGNSFTRKAITNLKLSEIDERMMNREGMNLKNVRIPRTGKAPFMLVFHNLPEVSTLTNYSVNVVSSKINE